MRKLIFYIILISAFATNAQQNLVQNGDFEIFYSLPTQTGQSNLAVGWNNVNGNYSGVSASPDYFNMLSFTYFGAIVPYSGYGQMGLYTYSFGSYREYISSMLNSQMEIGKLYKISFYLTNGQNTIGTFYSNNFAICFSNNIFAQSLYEPISVIPQIEIDTILYIWNYWEKFSFKYIADSAYKYITIGNFRSDSYTLVSMNGNIGAYYFIDKIEIIPELNIIGDTLICKGETAYLTATVDTVKWSEASHPEIIISDNKTIQVNPLITTTYLAYDAYDTASFTVYVADKPQINLGKDTSLCFGQGITLYAELNKATYLWQDNTTKSILNVTQAGQYWVIATDSNKCSASDSINIYYQYCTMQFLWIPNSFTPNGDGLNDVFKPETIAEMEEYKMLIFNRWGQQIFESNNINKAWDGKYKGRIVESGVYIYRIEARDKLTKEKKVYNGRVTLVMN